MSKNKPSPAALSAIALSTLLCAAMCCNRQKETTAATVQHGAFTDERDGRVYRTVTIGGHAWMAENLHYDADNSSCYDDNVSNCKIYGRLYTWEAALMACPDGWHLPDTAEWGALVGVAGGALKSRSGWSDNLGKSGNGTDAFGFSALPGGYRSSHAEAYFGYVGSSGYFWTASDEGTGSHDAHSRRMTSYNGYVYEQTRDKGNGYAVRCALDADADAVAITVSPFANMPQDTAPQPPASHPSFTDTRTGQVYRTVHIGRQEWMAENLNYKTDSSWCYDYDDSLCVKYGRLYDWVAAKTACPKGWRLPDTAEWGSLIKAAGGEKAAGKKLKSKTSWDSSGGKRGNGTDDYGFSALPGGCRWRAPGSAGDNDATRSDFEWSGSVGGWWSATSFGRDAYYISMHYAYESASSNAISTERGFSVRCVMDVDGALPRLQKAHKPAGDVFIGKVDNIVVHKSERRMSVYAKGKLLKTYMIALGGQPIGAKEFEGDQKTPEGVYFIDGKNPNSRYHKSIGISYPNEADVEYARRFGKSAGGDIRIHGLGERLGHIGDAHRLSDWTLGCIAVTNEEIDELYRALKDGTRIEIRP